jgi:Ala-tRNA(Pro) deacylase
MPIKKLKEYLDSNKVEWVSVYHSTAFTAQRIAASAHVSGKELAKTIMIKVDGKMAMAVLPASCKVNFDQLREAIGTSNIELASEKEFLSLFPDCEIGAMPPFGNLYGMEVYVAQKLTDDKEIYFNAGSHNELIHMSYKDYERLVRPKIVKFAKVC